MSPVRGILLKLLSVAVFAVMTACIKAARDVVPAGEAVFFRAFIALIPVIAYAAWSGHLRDAVGTRNLRGHFWRGAIGASSMGLSFAALGLLPLPEVIAIMFAAPIMATALAVVLLGETVRMFRWTAVLVGLVGVTIMVWPRLTILSAAETSALIGDAAALGAALALASAFLTALAQIHVRLLTRTEPVMAIVFWFHVTCTLGGLATLPFGWVWPDAHVLLMLVTAGLFGGVAQILVTESYRHAEASIIAPLEYTSMLYGVLIGWLIFDELVQPLVLIGAVVVIGSGLMILWRERQLGLREARASLRRGMPPEG